MGGRTSMSVTEEELRDLMLFGCERTKNLVTDEEKKLAIVLLHLGYSKWSISGCLRFHRNFFKSLDGLGKWHNRIYAMNSYFANPKKANEYRKAWKKKKLFCAIVKNLEPADRDEFIHDMVREQ
jgi:hypothetical protein